MGTSPDIVESMTERGPGFGERLLAGLGGALPEIAQPASPGAPDGGRSMRRELERLIEAAAAEGDVIILGRLGGTILRDRRDVVRVFVHAPLAWRIANVSASLGCSAADARAEIMRIDDARRSIARDHYGVAWGDVRLYHLTVDTARFGIDGAADVIAAAVRAVA